MTKRSHKNQKSRLTARERAKAFGESYYPFFSEKEVRAWTRVLEAHAAATLARHRRKVRAWT